jgi:dTDP-4-dehydrorhamnose reductase
MSAKIVLIGQNGQVGYELQHFLAPLGDLISFDRKSLDLSSTNDIRRSIRDNRPSIIVNAAAYTAVDKAESDEGAALAINAQAPRVMAEEAKRIGAVLVHYSTDYVFDGLKNSPYDENDSTNPLGVYGKTKLAGEQAIRDIGPAHLIFRTAWVYSTRGRNFLLTMLRLASERKELRVVRDQIGAPTWCREIARATAAVLTTILGRGDSLHPFAAAGGTYHMTAGGAASWYEFAQAILDEARRTTPEPAWLAAATQGRNLIAERVVPITTDEYPTPARRPPYSVLSNTLLHRTFGVKLPDWRQELHAAFADRKSYSG